MAHTKGPWKANGVRVDAPVTDGEGVTENLIALVYACRGASLGANAKAIAAVPDLIDVLEEAREYFDQRSDADCDQDGYIPNDEMRLLSSIDAALAKAGAL